MSTSRFEGRGRLMVRLATKSSLTSECQTVKISNCEKQTQSSCDGVLKVNDGEVWKPFEFEHDRFLPFLDERTLQCLYEAFPQKSTLVHDQTEKLKDDSCNGHVLSTSNSSQRIISDDNCEKNLSLALSEAQKCDNPVYYPEFFSPNTTEQDHEVSITSIFCNSNNSPYSQAISKMINSDDSDKDPDYVNENELLYSSSDSSIEHHSAVKVGRKRLSAPSEWKCAKSKRLRNNGQQYHSKYSKKIVAAKSLRSPCKNCKLNCSSKFTEDERQFLFSSFWKIGDVTRQREFVSRHLCEIIPHYRYTSDKPRKLNNAFYFEKGEIRIRVCKPFFLATLGINNRWISTTIKKTCNGFVEEDLRGKHSNHKKVDITIKNDIRTHIQSIPRIESHYLRHQTTREFVEGGNTIAGIHRDYVTVCKQNGKPFGNIDLFSKIFNTEFNISFFVPKKDLCEFCVAFENMDSPKRTEILEQHNLHLSEKNKSRIEKECDKVETNANVIVCTYDLQAAVTSPKGECSLFYYKSKLSTYNLTIYELKTGEGLCNVWHEGDANRGATEISTCICKYIEEKARENSDDLDFIFYTDNCGGQQKNKYTIVMYMYALFKFNNVRSISHKFLITGHTQNEGDGMHSVIEKEIKRVSKSGPIFVPSQYVQIMRGAKKRSPFYKVKEFTHIDFIDFKNLAKKVGQNFTCNTILEMFSFNDIRIFKVTKATPFSFFYKMSYFDEEYKEVDIFQPTVRRANLELREKRNSRKTKTTEAKLHLFKNWEEPQAYQVPTGITKRKKNDLMSLVNSNHIPRLYYDFYNNLRISC